MMNDEEAPTTQAAPAVIYIISFNINSTINITLLP